MARVEGGNPMRHASPLNQGHQPAAVVRVNERRYGLQGELSFSTAAALLQAIRAALGDAKGAVEIDLAETRGADSAGLALLIELVRFAKQRGIALSFSNISQQLESLATVSGVDGLLSRRS